jgi:hypothetical protein
LTFHFVSKAKKQKPKTKKKNQKVNMGRTSNPAGKSPSAAVSKKRQAESAEGDLIVPSKKAQKKKQAAAAAAAAAAPAVDASPKAKGKGKAKSVDKSADKGKAEAKDKTKTKSKSSSKAPDALAPEASNGINKSTNNRAARRKRIATSKAVFTQAPFTAALHKITEDMWNSGLFAGDIKDNAIGKAWLKGPQLAKKNAKGNLRRVLFGGGVAALLKNIVEHTIYLRMMEANNIARDRTRKLDGTIAKNRVRNSSGKVVTKDRATHVTGADLQRAKRTDVSKFVW